MNTNVTTSALSRMLRRHGVPINRWGKDGTKTVEDLRDEIACGESELRVTDGKVVRHTRVACVDIYFKHGDTMLWLKEIKQVFPDGRVRHRKLSTSAGEKLKAGEELVMGARRCLREELGFKDIVYIEQRDSDTEVVDSPSYPGLEACFERYFFAAYIMTNLFKPEGYVHDDGTKKIYFVWVAAD